MAVETNAGPVERALDEIAKVLVDAPVPDVGAQLIAALGSAALWRVVYEGAMEQGDSKLAGLAAEQIRNAQRAYRGLIEISDEERRVGENADPELDPHPAGTLPHGAGASDLSPP